MMIINPNVGLLAFKAAESITLKMGQNGFPTTRKRMLHLPGMVLDANQTLGDVLSLVAFMIQSWAQPATSAGKRWHINPSYTLYLLIHSFY